MTQVLADEDITKRQYLELSSEKWLILEDLVKVLEPFEVATTFLSGEANVSLSTVLPCNCAWPGEPAWPHSRGLSSNPKPQGQGNCSPEEEV